MGRNKYRSKRDRLNAKNPCRIPEVTALNKTINLENSTSDRSKFSDKYGIRHLIEKTIESRNDSTADGNAQALNVAKCIDLSNDEVLCEEEVIDLTQTTKKVESDSSVPTVIDISEDERGSEGEDVCVIGMFSKPPAKPLPKPTIKDRLGEVLKTNQKTVSSLIKCKSKRKKTKIKRKFEKMLKSGNFPQSQTFKCRSKENVCDIGSNMSVNSPMPLPSTGLRPIIIDGNNVAYVHSNYHFSCKRLEICINYFKTKGHKVTAFVPQYRMSYKNNDDPKLLAKLEKEGYVVFTPSKVIDGKKIVPYDDRFIVQTAVLKGGVIISRDNYKDLLHENPAWAETIKYRTLAFTWVDDVLMFPEDPLGEFGPKLEEFLRFH